MCLQSVEHSACIVLLLNTVLSELRGESEPDQRTLATMEELERMKGLRGDLSARLVPVLCTKSRDVVDKIADLLDKCQYTGVANNLRGREVVEQLIIHSVYTCQPQLYMHV